MGVRGGGGGGGGGGSVMRWKPVDEIELKLGETLESSKGAIHDTVIEFVVRTLRGCQTIGRYM